MEEEVEPKHEEVLDFVNPDDEEHQEEENLKSTKVIVFR